MTEPNWMLELADLLCERLTGHSKCSAAEPGTPQRADYDVAIVALRAARSHGAIHSYQRVGEMIGPEQCAESVRYGGT